MRFARDAGLFCACLLLASCARLPEQTATEMSWQDRVAQISALSHWKASGKLALRTPSQSESANLEWTQGNKITQILLSGPMGLGATAIESDTVQLRISRDGQTQVYDISSQAASDVIIGWDLPLQALPYWILGLPSPQAPVLNQLVEDGLLRQIKQLGWTITYEQYQQFEQYTLPTRLTIERDSTRARLIIRHWGNFSS